MALARELARYAPDRTASCSKLVGADPLAIGRSG